MATVTLDRLTKRYDATSPPAVDNATFRIDAGEFFVLLGPSGCGKSTTLRMIAGLEPITEGALQIDGQMMNAVPAKDRDIAMVFQSYALYPHMKVRDNLAFGLRRRGLPRTEIDRRVQDVASALELVPYLDRKPHALSGGQRQRVALGRAIVRDPKVFLFDEPLSNLDAALRISTRGELIRLHRRLGATMIYVTHDQVEAMTMGSRICIMDGGRVVQIGAPMEVYRNPANAFVAGFLGSPSMNLVPAVVADGQLKLGDQVVDLPNGWAAPAMGQAVTFGIRPEDLFEMSATKPPHRAVDLKAVVEAVEPLGAETLLMLRLPGIEKDVIARLGRDLTIRAGEAIQLLADLDAVRLFDIENGERLPLTEQMTAC